MAGRRDHWIVQRDHRQCADSHAFGLEFLEFGDAFFQRATRQRHAEHGFLECRPDFRGRGLFLQSVRAGILFLLMAPDAVIGLVQGTDQIGAGVRESEPVAPTHMGERVHGNAVLVVRFDRHQALKIELLRQLEQYARMMLVLSLPGMHRPGRIAQRCIDFVRVGTFLLQPGRYVTRKRQFAEIRIEPCSELGFEPGSVEPGSGLRLVGVDGLALHEQPLAGIQRSKFEMTRRQCVDFVFDAEQARDEIVEMTGYRDQEFRFLLQRQRWVTSAQGFQTFTQGGTRNRPSRR